MFSKWKNRYFNYCKACWNFKPNCDCVFSYDIYGHPVETSDDNDKDKEDNAEDDLPTSHQPVVDETDAPRPQGPPYDVDDFNMGDVVIHPQPDTSEPLKKKPKPNSKPSNKPNKPVKRPGAPGKLPPAKKPKPAPFKPIPAKPKPFKPAMPTKPMYGDTPPPSTPTETAVDSVSPLPMVPSLPNKLPKQPPGFSLPKNPVITDLEPFDNGRQPPGILELITSACFFKIFHPNEDMEMLRQNGMPFPPKNMPLWDAQGNPSVYFQHYYDQFTTWYTQQPLDSPEWSDCLVYDPNKGTVDYFTDKNGYKFYGANGDVFRSPIIPTLDMYNNPDKYYVREEGSGVWQWAHKTGQATPKSKKRSGLKDPYERYDDELDAELEYVPPPFSSIVPLLPLLPTPSTYHYGVFEYLPSKVIGSPWGNTGLPVSYNTPSVIPNFFRAPPMLSYGFSGVKDNFALPSGTGLQRPSVQLTTEYYADVSYGYGAHGKYLCFCMICTDDFINQETIVTLTVTTGDPSLRFYIETVGDVQLQPSVTTIRLRGRNAGINYFPAYVFPRNFHVQRSVVSVTFNGWFDQRLTFINRGAKDFKREGVPPSGLYQNFNYLNQDGVINTSIQSFVPSSNRGLINLFDIPSCDTNVSFPPLLMHRGVIGIGMGVDASHYFYPFHFPDVSSNRYVLTMLQPVYTNCPSYKLRVSNLSELEDGRITFKRFDLRGLATNTF